MIHQLKIDGLISNIPLKDLKALKNDINCQKQDIKGKLELEPNGFVAMKRIGGRCPGKRFEYSSFRLVKK